MLRFDGIRQLTDSEKGAATHDQSGNTSSNVLNRVGVRIEGQQFLVDTTSGSIIQANMVAREQCWHIGGKPVTAELLEGPAFPVITPAPGESGYNWTIVPAAENDVEKHGGVIWLRRRAWSNDQTKVIPQWFMTYSVESKKFGKPVPVFEMTAETNIFRRQEIHACHQDKGNLLFLHERERAGVYGRDSFIKQWMLVDRNAKLLTVCGKGLDHPTYRNSRLYFTTSSGIANAQGGDIHRFDDGVACQHQCLDAAGNLVCSLMRRSPGGWLEFEIRVLDKNWATIASLPLHQVDQSEAGNAWALLSRPFGFSIEGKYKIVYHEPSEEDWGKPIGQRRPQVWVATFSDASDPPPGDDSVRVDQLVEQVYDLKAENKKLSAGLEDLSARLVRLEEFVRSEFERPLIVVRK